MEYLNAFGIDNNTIDTMRSEISDSVYSDLCFLSNMVKSNISYLKDFGVTNYREVVIKYPEIFLRDEENFKAILAKFDKEDLIQKVTKNPAVFKKMVEYVDNN